MHKPKARKRVGFTISGLAPKRSQGRRTWCWLAERNARLLPNNRPHDFTLYTASPHPLGEGSFLNAASVNIDCGGVG